MVLPCIGPIRLAALTLPSISLPLITLPAWSGVMFAGAVALLDG
jgi:hypothetical protein